MGCSGSQMADLQAKATEAAGDAKAMMARLEKGGQRNKLEPGTGPKSEMKAENGKYRVILQEDGNCVEYEGDGGDKPLWSTGTDGKKVTHIIMQDDGNLVLYNDAEPVWASNTVGTEAAMFVVQDDGNIVIFDKEKKIPFWARFGDGVPEGGGLVQKITDKIEKGWHLKKKEFLKSPNGKYTVVHQEDGNVVEIEAAEGEGEPKVVWHTETNGKDTTHLVLQEDGNLVLYNDAEPVWASNTNGKESDHFVVQDDGNIVIFDKEKKPFWARFGDGVPEGGGVVGNA